MSRQMCSARANVCHGCVNLFFGHNVIFFGEFLIWKDGHRHLLVMRNLKTSDNARLCTIALSRITALTSLKCGVHFIATHSHYV